MKNYLIVGASSGIGAQLCQQLAAHTQNRVWGTYYQHETVSSAPNLSYHYLNVLDDNLNFDFLPDTLDGLAFCVGKISLKPFSRISQAEYIADYQAQVLGAVKTIQAVLPRLKAAPNASIVLFSTVAVQTGFSFHALVAASKGAIEGITRALAAELAPKIRVNALAPSITDTPLAQNLLNTPEKKEANAQRHPLKKIGSAADLANAAEFLLSEQSGWITGQIVAIDGGISSLRI
ncbi:NAD(P)-dependent dehydrogenase, short-chain alcohol dehydrogenase family [Flexibacter flexilis DSM 6793]|uniref:NAD(P)-dependent dehydrogenase, short-chain alcohol dehydrogenase family n=1 Tax=Flexibacter flexilis DSM 6793 TaxID=927664 RepID=A0A1I1DEG3_9BACT|nr:SDR family oxidoreductase [Flexibacter flexilis]SFB72776.1 NAD(P)-dependent dehydrogenase, short-chain alcohol dehydrogenase family [Flexibacter flexilis DSM 6793]